MSDLYPEPNPSRAARRDDPNATLFITPDGWKRLDDLTVKEMRVHLQRDDGLRKEIHTQNRTFTEILAELGRLLDRRLGQ